MKPNLFPWPCNPKEFFVYHFLKRVFAGLRQAGQAPASATSGRRTCLAVECLEERLALSSFPNLTGDVFLFKSPANVEFRVEVVRENQHTGAFAFAFFPSQTFPGTGQIGRPQHNLASITFLGSEVVRPNRFGLEIETASFSGSVKGERRQAVITGSFTLVDRDVFTDHTSTLFQIKVTGRVVPK
jgi:hypothetical protein